MFLKSLEIQGFKSFPDKLCIEFSKGLTAIVGPNGSGKSNIAEAILWVLGEQSSRNLRSSKMEDVIFGGTALRKPVGFAEVSLTLDNSDGALPIEYSEVTVTRRYYRSGESEYSINRKPVRLKDVHELLMDTGLGRDGYSIIGQGRIAEILSQKSDDRRQIFEEAAGISKFRYRKTETLRKLSATEENLVRTRDILSELEDRLPPLEHEAQKARRFLDLREEKKRLEINVWLRTIEDSRANAEKIRQDFQIVQSQTEQAALELERLEGSSEELFLRNQRINADIDRLHNLIRELEERLLTLDNSRSLLENDKNHNQSTLASLEEGSSAMNERMACLDEEIGKKLAEIESKGEARRAVILELEGLSAERDSLLQSLSEASDKTQELKLKISALASKLTEKRIELSSLAAGGQAASERLESIDKELDDRNDALEKALKAQNALKCEIEKLSDDLKSLNNMLDGYKKKLAAREQKHQENNAALSQIVSELDKKTNEKTVLEDMDRYFEGFSASVKTVMQRAASGRLKGIHGPVSSLISVEDRYAVAVETALGSTVQQIVVDTENDAKSAISLLKNENAGRATFLPLSSIRGGALSEKGLSGPGFVGIASSLVKADGRYKSIVESLLGRTVVVESIDDAVALARKNQYRFRIVTLDGQVVNAGGSITGGSTVKNSGVLSRKNKIASLKDEITALEGRRAEAEKGLKALQTELSALRASLDGVQAEMRVQEDALIRKKAESEQADILIQSLKEALEALWSERREIVENRGGFESRMQAVNGDITSLQSEIKALEERLESLGVDAKEIESSRESLNEVISQKRLLEISISKDIESLEAAVESLRQQKHSFSVEADSRLAQIDILKQKNIEIEAAEKELEKQILETGVQAEKAKGDLDALIQEREKLELETTRVRQLIKEKTREKERLLQEAARFENKLSKFESEYDNLIKMLWDEYELTLSGAASLRTELGSFSKAKERIAELKGLIKQLGDVNVASIEEYKTVSERYRFLKEQVDDLENSKQELNKIIDELTLQMQQIFKAKFSEINRHFGVVFSQLFGGGRAQISLADPEDVLSSGIEIQVEPPGKIIKNLSALSGGEQALVAIALYFAILKVNPAPFCVLDEIEAALDDPNILRFANYLSNFTDSTQFIIITHRRGTMEAADILYGVTMEEQGVSKILAINVAEMEEHIEQSRISV